MGLDVYLTCAYCDRESHGNAMWRARHRRVGRTDWTSALAVVILCFLFGVCGYVLGWDHQCTKDLSGIDRERSTATANCIREEQWRDGLTVACGRATR